MDIRFFANNTDIDRVASSQELAVYDVFHQMGRFDLAEVKSRIAQSCVCRVVLGWIIQIMLPLYVVAEGFGYDEGIFEELKIFGDSRFCCIESGQCFDSVGKFGRVGKSPDSTHGDIDNLFKHGVIPDMIALNDITDINGLVYVQKIFFLGHLGIHQHAIGKPAEADIFVEKGLGVMGVAFKVCEFEEGEGCDVDDLSATAKFGCNIGRKHFGVGAGDIDVNIRFAPESIKNAIECDIARVPFVWMHFCDVYPFRQDLVAGLNLINKDIAGGFHSRCFGSDELVKGDGIGQVLVGRFLKVYLDDAAGGNSAFKQMLPEDCEQKITFAATPNASQYFDKMIAFCRY